MRFLRSFKKLLSHTTRQSVLIRHASRIFIRPIFIRRSIISWVLTRTLIQFRHPSVIALARRRLMYTVWEPIRSMHIVRKFREEHLQRRTYANGKSTVPRIKFMLREATVIAEEHFFPPWETVATRWRSSVTCRSVKSLRGNCNIRK